MRAVKSVSIDSDNRVSVTYLDGSTEILFPEDIDYDEAISLLNEQVGELKENLTESAGDLKSALSFITDNGYTYLDLASSITWVNAYVNSNGKLVSSTASITGLVTMHAGESVKIGTSNSNVTIIGSTDASSLAVGDTVTQIQKTTTSGNYEEYTYKAREQINIVLCVKKSDYNILFYKDSAAVQDVRDKIYNLHKETFTETFYDEKEYEYNATSGTTIYAESTNNYVSFSVGEKVCIELTTENSAISQYLLYFNGTNIAQNLPNKKYIYELSENLTRVAFYCPSVWVIGTGQLRFKISKCETNNNSLEKTVDSKIGNIETAVIDGYFLLSPTANGSFSSAGSLTTAPNRIRTEFIPFKKNQKMVIENGMLEHAVGMWNGTPSSQTNTRNDYDWITNDETIKFDYDGYIVIVFRKSDNSDITLSDFDGTILNYNTFASTNEDASSEELPDYYVENSYLLNKANRINELAKQGDDVFVFITDVHWELNAKHSPDLVKYIAEQCNIPRLFDGGDLADGIKRNSYVAFRKSFDRKIYRAVGNHDRFPPFTGQNLYYAFDNLNNDQIGNAFNHYYYVDNVQQKIRYVILNAFYHEGNETGTGWSHYDEEQKNWFSQTALNLPSSDWDVIVFTHFLKTTSYLTGAADIGNAIDSFNEQPGHTGKILAVFQGHIHWDGIYHTAGGVPVITTTCDKWDLSNESSTIPSEGIAFREVGTVKEQALDVVILNRASKKFTCVRIGAPAQDNVDVYRTQEGFTWIGTLQEREISYGE